MLEDAAVPLFLDVLEIFARWPAGWILLAHVAETAGKLGETFPVRTLTEPFHGEMRWLDEGRTSKNGDAGLGKNHGSEIFVEIGEAATR
jgi:hypothetical protein